MSSRQQTPRATGPWLALVRAIEAAGGTIVRYTKNQHIVVRGPDGRTVTVARPHVKDAGRSLRNNISLLRRIGLEINIP